MEREMQKLIDEKDWSKTPVGARKTWPDTLSTLLSIMLKSRFPMFLFWGPELTCFYNDAFKPSLGANGKHPLILGVPGKEAWAEIWDMIKPMLDEVLAGGSIWNEDLLVPFYRNGRIEDIYWTFSYSPVTENGNVNGILVICHETTEKVLSAQVLKKSENKFRDIVYQAPIGITIFRGEDFVVEMANQTYLQIIDKNEADLIGKPFFKTMPELESTVGPLLRGVLRTGTPYYGTEFRIMLKRYGTQEETYFNFVYYPLKESDGAITGLIVVANEVTEQVKAKFNLQESEKKFRDLVMKSPIPMTIFKGDDYVVEVANQVMFEKIWRKKESDVIGRKILDVFPELKEQKYPDLLDKVYRQGIIHNEKESVAYVQGDDGMRKFILDFEYTPLTDPAGKVWGIMVTVNDVSEKVEGRKRAEENEERLNIVIDASDLGTWEVNFKTKEIHYSDRYLEILGYKTRVELTHEQILKHLHPDDLPIREAAYKRAFETGILHYESRLIWNDGSIHWMEGKGKVFFGDDGTPVRMLGTLRDTTEEKNQKTTLEKSEQKFRLLAESMPQFVWTASYDGAFNYHNESIFEYAGLKKDPGNHDLWSMVLHPDDRAATLAAWDRSFKTGLPFRIEHRFKTQDGDYRWQLSRAIPQRDATGKILMWVGTSTDIQDQKMFADELERQVSERTAELEQKNRDLEKMNAELQSFAYVSSHDLQEPLRKIQTFASRIVEKESLSEKGADYFRRIQESANRMQKLIQDLLAYSRTSKAEPVFEKVNLREIVNDIRTDFHEVLSEKKITIEMGDAIELHVIPLQFRQVMFNLISNAIKFARPDVQPRILIEAHSGIRGETLKPRFAAEEIFYCNIRVTDNGIGFDPKYKERIFEVFQRLHGKHEYSGTGVGLAIVKKIIENHRGFVDASGRPGDGATFEIYVPA